MKWNGRISFLSPQQLCMCYIRLWLDGRSSLLSLFISSFFSPPPICFHPYTSLISSSFSLKLFKKLSLAYLDLCPRSILLVVVASHSIPPRNSICLFVPFPFPLFRLLWTHIYVLESNCFRVSLSPPQFLSFFPILPSLHSELSGGCIIDRHLYLWHLLLLTPPSLPLSLPLSPSLSVCLAWCSLAGT